MPPTLEIYTLVFLILNIDFAMNLHTCENWLHSHFVWSELKMQCLFKVLEKGV
jgi:hypothetical protein